MGQLGIKEGWVNPLRTVGDLTRNNPIEFTDSVAEEEHKLTGCGFEIQGDTPGVIPGELSRKTGRR